MKTEHKLGEALKTMMAAQPLDSISVTSLTRKCKVNRQTFYYYFHDTYDLLTLVFLNEKIEGLVDTTNIKDLVKGLYKYYERNHGFIDAALNSAGKQLVYEFFYNACYQNILRFVITEYDSKELTPNERKSIARYYASAYSNSIVYYFSNFKEKTLNGLLNTFCFVSDVEIEKAVQNYLKIKGKIPRKS